MPRGVIDVPWHGVRVPSNPCSDVILLADCSADYVVLARLTCGLSKQATVAFTAVSSAPTLGLMSVAFGLLGAAGLGFHAPWGIIRHTRYTLQVRTRPVPPNLVHCVVYCTPSTRGTQ